METWLLLVSISIPLILLLLNKSKNNKYKKLPPGPLAVPVIGNLLWLKRSINDVKSVLRETHARYGPIITLRIGSRVQVFIADRELAHRALVEQGVTLADRPKQTDARRILTSGQHNITSANYGPLWRLLRRTLVSETLHPSQVRLFAPARSWVLGVLTDKLKSQSESNNGVVSVMETIQYAMFCLLVLMCFGTKLDEEAVREIASAQRALLLYGSKLNVFAFAPPITRILFRKRWEKALEMRRRQKKIYMPLIKARVEYKKNKEANQENDSKSFAHSYVDSLLELRLPEEGGRTLSDDEMMALCSEFLDAGTDTTSTGLQWIMAEIVRHPEIQQKLWNEIKNNTSEDDMEIKEEDIHKLPYLKAVVLEGLRRHPPAHFVLPHAPSDDMEIGGYVIPKGTTVNFMVAEMGRDEKMWDRPMEFVPERFLQGGDGEGVDITGNREIRMMPFGVGRRMCPGLNIAMLHLEYFVANLVREFEWKEVEGEEVDLSEKSEFTVVMKKPLKAKLVPRMKS